MINMLNTRPNTLPEHILKVLEVYWGFNLPSVYRNFLIKNNGGEPEKDVFCFKEKKTGSDIRSFLCIFPDNNSNLLNYIKTYKGRIPDNMFPIAYDSFGNLILIGVKNPNRGKIYFWDHDMETDPSQGEKPDYSNMTLIADSFEEFIDGLYEDELGED